MLPKKWDEKQKNGMKSKKMGRKAKKWDEKTGIFFLLFPWRRGQDDRGFPPTREWRGV